MGEITVIGIVQSLSYILVLEDFYSMALKPFKVKKKNYILLWGLYFTFHLCALINIKSIAIKFAGNLCFVFIILCIGYYGTIKEKCITEFLGEFTIAVVEAVLVVTVKNIDNNNPVSNPVYGILANIGFWIVVHLLFGVTPNKRLPTSKKMYITVLAIVLSLNGGLCTVIVYNSLQENNEIITNLTWGLSVALLIIDIVGFKIYTMFQEKLYMQNENQQYLLQLQINEKQMEERQAVIDNVKMMRHDMKQQLLYVQGLMEKNPEEAYKYVDVLIDTADKKEKDIAFSGNITVDALLNHKYLLARKYGIEFKMQLSIPVELPQFSGDICIVVGNLLDNAIEALMQEEKNKKIEMVMKYEQKKLYINVKNYYSGKLLKKDNGDYITQKADKANHGIGLNSVKKCVDKNEGIILIKTENNIFDVTVII